MRKSKKCCVILNFFLFFLCVLFVLVTRVWKWSLLPHWDENKKLPLFCSSSFPHLTVLITFSLPTKKKRKNFSCLLNIFFFMCIGEMLRVYELSTFSLASFDFFLSLTCLVFLLYCHFFIASDMKEIRLKVLNKFGNFHTHKKNLSQVNKIVYL